MVKRCALCGVVDNDDVSVHRYFTRHVNYNIIINNVPSLRFPSAEHRRLEWVAFVVDQGFPVHLTSQLCSRHFVPGVDYVVGMARRRRLFPEAVPSLVSV